jgi:plasmid maintenance system killer protein
MDRVAKAGRLPVRRIPPEDEHAHLRERLEKVADGFRCIRRVDACPDGTRTCHGASNTVDLHEVEAKRFILASGDIPKTCYNVLGMWTIVEERAATKVIDKLPTRVAEKYAFWCAVVRQSGPQGLRAIKSMHDEKLSGPLAHLRSSRLSQQWRVLYRADKNTVTVYVERVSPHDYRP